MIYKLALKAEQLRAKAADKEESADDEANELQAGSDDDEQTAGDSIDSRKQAAQSALKALQSALLDAGREDSAEQVQMIVDMLADV